MGIKRDNKVRDSVPEPKVQSTGVDIKALEEAHGGPGVFNFDTRRQWDLKRDEWRFDAIPQFYLGKNVADFYRKDIDKDLEALEAEERDIMMGELETAEERERERKRNLLSADDELLARFIKRKIILRVKDSHWGRARRDRRVQMPRMHQKIPLSELKADLGDLGIGLHKVSQSIKEQQEAKEKLTQRRGRSRLRKTALQKIGGQPVVAVPITVGNKNRSFTEIQAIARAQSRSKSRTSRAAVRANSRSRSRARRAPSKGITSISASSTALTLKNKALKSLNRDGKCHPSDRHIYNPKPLHLFKGKNAHCAGR